MLHCVYDISDLVEDAADANNLIRSITETIEPESWYELSDKGEGTIVAYPLRQPKNFAVMQTYRILQQIIRFLDDTRSSRREREKTTPTIKPQEMQILRQQYINNDSIVKFVTERITKKEAELIELRQKFTPSHPEVRNKASLLRALKKSLQERKNEVGKSFDNMMATEIYQTNRGEIATLLDELRKTKEHQQQPSQVQEEIDKFLDESEELMTPLEQVQKQLDELIKQQQALKVTEPNLPPTPKVKLISNTFIDCPLRDALKSIGKAANVNIMTDGTIEGIISCTLKDVTVETALDIVLAGTPYAWKKTPDCYVVVSGVELPEIATRMESTKKLSNLGKALLEYANDYADKYPDSLHRLTNYLNVEELTWILANVEYLAHGKQLASRPDTVLAYDKKLLAKGKGTNLLYNDFHVSFEKVEKLKKLGISESEIMIETVFLSVSEDYLKDVGLDAKTANFSDGWTRHLAAKYPAGPNGQPYGLIIDDLHVRFLLRSVQANHDSKAIVAPRVRTRAGTTADIGTTEEYRYIRSYTEPDSPSDEPQPKRDKVKLGPHMWLTPKLTDNTRNVNLDLKLEMRQLEGIIEGKYKGKYPYYKPVVDVISAKMPCTIPKGKTMLIGGLKIIEPIKKTRTPGLKDLPLIGAALSSNDKPRDQKMLLILVKPVTNPQQKATKIRPGQEASEEHIKRLAEQLDKKINPSGKPR
jgi:hypothetical protein